MIIHGFVRTTVDTDILINATEENADKMLFYLGPGISVDGRGFVCVFL